MELQDIVKIAVVICSVTCFIHSGHALRCYDCYQDGPYSNVTCTGKIKNCSQTDTHCNIYSIKGSTDYQFTRACAPKTVCEKGWCKKMEDMLSKTNCMVKCCNSDLCNRDAVSSGQRLIPFTHALSLLTLCAFIV